MNPLRESTDKLLIALSAFAGGVAIGLLMAPRSGRQTRRRLASGAASGRQWIDEALTSTGEQLSGAVREVVDATVDRYAPELEGPWSQVGGEELVRDLKRLPGR